MKKTIFIIIIVISTSWFGWHRVNLPGSESNDECRRLIAALEAADPVTRGEAARALGEESFDRHIITKLLPLLQDHSVYFHSELHYEDSVCSSAAWALSRLLVSSPTQRTPLQSNVVSALIKSLETEYVYSKRGVIEALSSIKDHEAINPLLKMANDSDQDQRVRVAAAYGLGEMAAVSSVPALIRLLNGGNWYLSGFAAEALGKIGSPRAVPPLISILEHLRSWDRTAYEVAESLSRLGTRQAEDALITLLNNRRPEARKAVIPLVVYALGERSVPYILARVHDPVPDIQKEAASWFEMIAESSTQREAHTEYTKITRSEEALAVINEALEKGIAATGKSEWRYAISWFLHARKIAPSYLPTLYNLGLACEREGGRELEAVAWYNAYLAAAGGRAKNRSEIKTAIKHLQRKIVADINQLAQEAHAFLEVGNVQDSNAFQENLEEIIEILRYWEAFDLNGTHLFSWMIEELDLILPAKPASDAMITGHGLLPRRNYFASQNLPLTYDIFSLAEEGNIAKALVDAADYRPYEKKLGDVASRIERQSFAFYRIAIACVSNKQPKMAVWLAEHIDYFSRSRGAVSLGSYKETASLRADVYRHLIKDAAKSSSGSRGFHIAFWSNLAMSYRPAACDKSPKEPQWEFLMRKARTKTFRLRGSIEDMTGLGTAHK